MCFSSTASSFRSIYAFSFLIENIAETIRTAEKMDTTTFDVVEFEAQEKYASMINPRVCNINGMGISE
jgi:hypothetical protein